MKTKTPSNVTFKVTGAHHTKKEKDTITADIEASYAHAKHGLTFTQTWTTDNILKSCVELENKMAKGLKVELHTTLLPEKSEKSEGKSATLSAIYKQSGIHTRAALDVFHVSLSLSPDHGSITTF